MSTKGASQKTGPETEASGLFDDSPAGILLVRVDGTPLRTNQTFRDLLGYSAGELSELSVLQLIHPEDRAPMTAVYSDLIAGKSNRVRLEKRYVHKDGHIVWAEITSRVVRQSNGDPMYVQTVVLDASERVRAQTESRILQEENYKISEFIASLSHEFRTPLNAVLGFAQLLLDDPREPLSARQRQSVQHIDTGGKHLLRLINDILDLAKVKAGQIELQPEAIEAAAAMRDAAVQISPLALKKGIRVSLHADSALQVTADRGRLHQILLNILANAVKFTPAGGTIVLSAVPGVNQVAISVADTGCGIPADQLDEIFDEYRQATRKQGSTQEGTGLGLALSRRFATLMKGTLTVVSEVEKGSTFTLTLPSSVISD